MTIISHYVKATSLNGKRKTVQYNLVDDVLGDIPFEVFVDKTVVTEPIALAQYSVQDGYSKDDEVSARVAIAQQGGNPDILIASLNYWVDQQEFDRALLIEFMRLQKRDPLTFRYSIPFWTRASNDVAPGNNSARGARWFMSGTDYAEIDSAYGLAQGAASYHDTIANTPNYTEPEPI